MKTHESKLLQIRLERLVQNAPPFIAHCADTYLVRALDGQKTDLYVRFASRVTEYLGLVLLSYLNQTESSPRLRSRETLGAESTLLWYAINDQARFMRETRLRIEPLLSSILGCTAVELLASLERVVEVRNDLAHPRVFHQNPGALEIFLRNLEPLLHAPLLLHESVGRVWIPPKHVHRVDVLQYRGVGAPRPRQFHTLGDPGLVRGMCYVLLQTRSRAASGWLLGVHPYIRDLEYCDPLNEHLAARRLAMCSDVDGKTFAFGAGHSITVEEAAVSDFNSYVPLSLSTVGAEWFAAESVIDPSVLEELERAGFTVKDVLGRGAFGTVLLVGHEKSSECALKVLDRGVSVTMSRNLREEILRMKNTRSPNVVKYLDFENSVRQETPPLWFTMEYLKGTPLSQWLELEETRAQSDTQKREIILQIAKGLASLHERGIVHRDLRPENIMICGGTDLRAVIVDLGLARFMRNDPRSRIATSIAALGVWGQRPYAPPEQLHVRSVLDASDPRVDVHALGWIMIALLFGADKLAEDQPDLQNHKWSSLIRMCIKSDPEERPRDGTDVLRKLVRLQAASAEDSGLRYAEGMNLPDGALVLQPWCSAGDSSLFETILPAPHQFRRGLSVVVRVQRGPIPVSERVEQLASSYRLLESSAVVAPLLFYSNDGERMVFSVLAPSTGAIPIREWLRHQHDVTAWLRCFEGLLLLLKTISERAESVKISPSHLLLDRSGRLTLCALASEEVLEDAFDDELMKSLVSALTLGIPEQQVGAIRMPPGPGKSEEYSFGAKQLRDVTEALYTSLMALHSLRRNFRGQSGSWEEPAECALDWVSFCLSRIVVPPWEYSSHKWRYFEEVREWEKRRGELEKQHKALVEQCENENIERNRVRRIEFEQSQARAQAEHEATEKLQEQKWNEEQEAARIAFIDRERNRLQELILKGQGESFVALPFAPLDFPRRPYLPSIYEDEPFVAPEEPEYPVKPEMVTPESPAEIFYVIGNRATESLSPYEDFSDPKGYESIDEEIRGVLSGDFHGGFEAHVFQQRCLSIAWLLGIVVWATTKGKSLDLSDKLVTFDDIGIAPWWDTREQLYKLWLLLAQSSIPLETTRGCEAIRTLIAVVDSYAVTNDPRADPKVAHSVLVDFRDSLGNVAAHVKYSGIGGREPRPGSERQTPSFKVLGELVNMKALAALNYLMPRRRKDDFIWVHGIRRDGKNVSTLLGRPPSIPLYWQERRTQ